MLRDAVLIKSKIFLSKHRSELELTSVKKVGSLYVSMNQSINLYSCIHCIRFVNIYINRTIANYNKKIAN